MTFVPGTFRVVDKLQKLGVDINEAELDYARCRILVSKEFKFDASHHLHNYEGKCKNLHGHTYKVVVGISGYTDDRGIVVDFGDIKQVWKEHLEPYLDHQYLNETLPKMNTTAENMVVWMYKQFASRINAPGLPRVEWVRLYETETSYAEVTRDWFERSLSLHVKGDLNAQG